MARIFYSMSGEGRGHATRVRAIADLLRDRHEISLFAPGDAYELLEPAYRGSDIRVRRIPCLRFFYTPSGRLDTLRTVRGGIGYLRRYPRLRDKLCQVIRHEKPDVIITDFEPALPRAARRCGVPFISLNHQYFLIVNDLSSLPPALRLHASIMSLVVRGYHPLPELSVVSSFYFPPLRKRYQDAVQTGVILRPSILQAEQRQDGHVVAYMRRFATPNVLAALRECGRPVKLYGLGEKPSEGNIDFLEISEEDFVRDLASSYALVCTAGNQLVGEALYLGKPVFAMPEPNNREQYINAIYLERERTGTWVELESVNAAHIQEFLRKCEEYRGRIQPARYNGNPLAINAIEGYLAKAEAKATPPG